jgi:periplasmic protein TonB
MHSQHILHLDELNPALNRKASVVLPPPKAGAFHDVFEEAMLEDTSAHQRRSPLDWAAALGIHFAVLAMLLILPLYFTAGLDMHRLNLTFLAAPPVPAAPPPPPLAAARTPRPVQTAPHVFKAGQLIAPTFIPKTVSTAPEAAAPPEDAMLGVPGGVPGGIPGGQLGGVFGGVPGGGMKVAPAAPVASGPKVPVRVGGNVKPPRLLFGPAPDYPVLARQARLSGVVIIEAVIDEHGEVKGMRAISGHPLLIPAALSAVAKRKYEPTVLDGEPTPIDLRVEISFSFS